MRLLNSLVFLCLFISVWSHYDISNIINVTYIKQNIPDPSSRLHYHLMPPVGHMKKPSGFTFYKGEYHLFYEYSPLNNQQGPLHWGHVTSRNLVNWDHLPNAIKPDNEECLAGSSFIFNDSLVLIYTSRQTTNKSPFYTESQKLSFSDNGVYFTKYIYNPVLNHTLNDFRNPKVWKHGDYWYTVISSQSSDKKGQILLYNSLDIKNWQFLNVLAESTHEDDCVWESPDLFELSGTHILMWFTMNRVPPRHPQTRYVTGNFDYETFKFEQNHGFHIVDYGHDFYATQSTENKGQRILIARFGIRQPYNYDSMRGWSGAMTIPRELKLLNNRLLMIPVEELSKLRNGTIWDGKLKQNDNVTCQPAAEVIVTLDLNAYVQLAIKGFLGGESIFIKWDPYTYKIKVKRLKQARQAVWLPTNSDTWRIFLDASSIELFCGDGEVVFSSRVFPKGKWIIKNLNSNSINVVVYNLKKSDYEPYYY